MVKIQDEEEVEEEEEEGGSGAEQSRAADFVNDAVVFDSRVFDSSGVNHC